jgi:transposase
MSKELVSDELWEAIEPLLPEEPEKPKGRPRLPDRATLTGIVFMLKSGIPWEMLPKEMGCASGSICWRRLKEWEEAWQELLGVLLDRLGEAEEIDWERASLDRTSILAKRGQKTGKNPTDKGKPGSKRHLVVDRNGVPLAVVLTAANVHDCTVLEELVDAIEAIKRPRGRPRMRPKKLHADKPYNTKKCREALRRRRIKVRIARKCKESSEQPKGGTGGLWCARWHGLPSTVGSRFAMSGGTTSTRRSSISADR